jgi:hypothetical protein
MRHGLRVAVAALLSMAPLAAQQARDPAAILASAKSVKCEFSLYTLGDWKSGQPHADVKPAKLSFRFEDVDSEVGTASAIGPFGASDIIVRLSTSSLHFLQSFREGPVYVTTLLGRPGADGRWQAVHTRHEFTEVSLPGYTSRPEQYYGYCTVEP